MVNPDSRISSSVPVTSVVSDTVEVVVSKGSGLVSFFKDAIIGPIQKHPYVAGGLVLLATVAAVAYFATTSGAKKYPDILKAKLDLTGIDFNQSSKEVATAIVESLGERRWKLLDDVGAAPQSLTVLVDGYLDPVESLSSAKGHSLIILGPNKDDIVETFYLEYDAEKNNVKVYQPNNSKVLTIESSTDLKDLFPDFDNTYAIIFAPMGHTDRPTTIELETQQENDVEGTLRNFRHFVAIGEEVPKVAPFHHEYQTGALDGKCGMYALNAYIGRNQVGVKAFGEFLVKHQIETEQSQGVALEVEDAEAMVYPKHLTEKGLDKTNLTGSGAFEVQAYLKELASTGAIPDEVGNTKVVAVNTFLGENLLEKLESEVAPIMGEIDRFIFGVGGMETHFITWRKDEEGKWWKIDSLMSEQKSFTAEEAIEEINSDYGGEQGILYIILPDRT